MKNLIYIASTLTNADRVRRIRDLLAAHGVGLTYDWTAHNGGVPYVRNCDRAQKSEVAVKELAGVRDAKLLLVILPGGGGTHFEFGAAYGTKPVIMLTDEQPGDDGPDAVRTPCFHYLPDVIRVSTESEAIEAVLAQLNSVRG